jgi:two-component system, OmpR family, sensor histidine kinase SenX3
VVVPIVLMAVLAVLAALQYHWLGQVSQAERQRMHETMTARARSLANDIEREISRLYLTFQLREPDADRVEQAVGERYRVWRETTRHPDLITGVYLLSAQGTLQAFDAESHTLETVEWPAQLTPIRDRNASARMTRVQTLAAPAGGSQTSSAFSFRMTPIVSTDPLAISVLLPFMTHHTSDGVTETRVFAQPGSLLLVLDQQKFVGEILPQLITQHLGDSLDEYRLSIVKTRTPSDIVYASTTDWVLFDPELADVRVDALSLRPAINERVLATELRAVQALTRSSGGPPPPEPPPGAVALARPPAGGGVGSTLAGVMAGGALGSGAWQVLLKHRAGSLEAAVERVRRRNLLMSFGMLALLAASVGLVLVSARRAERLASQQMDFVATVSHELRTPLAVIRSAGQNLAAGVVQDPKRYGDLIETEGRRLTDMVEQTLALAGLSGERKPVSQQPVDAGDIARAVLASPETAARADGVQIDLRVAAELPLVLADEMLLRRGVQNLVANALKYGAAGGWLGVTVDASGSRRGREVRITVSDRGPGVAAEDLPHIFDPFYRGRRAVADQVQGNGLGLHLVRRIAEAHGGKVTVRTAPGEGAAFTIHLPARGDLALHALAGEQPA